MTKHTGHTIEYFPSGLTIERIPASCKVCSEAHKIEEQEKKRLEKMMRQHANRLDCDICGLSFGWVYANDLNGSRFYCDNCKIGSV